LIKTTHAPGLLTVLDDSTTLGGGNVRKVKLGERAFRNISMFIPAARLIVALDYLPKFLSAQSEKLH
jgi:hypothetical protein